MLTLALTYTFKNVLIGTTLLGVVGGVLGCFALLRKQSLLGDALAHASLPGVCLAFLVVGAKESSSLLLGALLTGVAGSLFVLMVVRGSRLKEDSAIGIVLSVFFGVGVVLLTWIEKNHVGANQSGLDHFLYGQAATLRESDITVFTVVGLLVLGTIALFYKELKLLCFDREYGSSLGYPMGWLEVLLTCLLVVTVVVGLQTVGVVLVVASLITPAAAARQWTDRFLVMLVIAGSVGGLSSVLGALASEQIARVPTGPAIVLVSSVVLVISLLLAPRRGLLWAWLQARALALRIRRENLLKDIYGWAERRGDWTRWPSLAELMGVRGQSSPRVLGIVRPLVHDGLITVEGETIGLTEDGLEEAERVVRKHRIWELYLARRLDLPSDHVHRDAEAMEHALSDEALEEFEELLGYPELDPHGQPIPPRRRPGEALPARIERRA